MFWPGHSDYCSAVQCSEVQCSAVQCSGSYSCSDGDGDGDSENDSVTTAVGVTNLVIVTAVVACQAVVGHLVQLGTGTGVVGYSRDTYSNEYSCVTVTDTVIL